MSTGAAHLGVDTGGTFTDFVARDGRVVKIPSSASSPGGVLEAGMLRLFEEASTGGELAVAHGTTVATNALLTGNLARTGLLVTRGFRDVLALGRQNRAALYDLHPTRGWEAPDRRHCLEIDERVGADGKVITPLDRDAVAAALETLRRRRVEAVAVCFLHSWCNPRHERAAAKMARAAGFSVTASSELVPEFREFERFSTAFANASLMPLLAAYVADLKRRGGAVRRALRLRAAPRLTIMQSSGGMIGADQAAREPVRLVLSGPAGGVVGAWAAVGGRERPRLVTLDMGGTSTDVSLLDGGEACVTRCEIAHRPLVVPVIDIHTVGAGGGSIAHADTGGALRVGPQSAGAEPGPACYGSGGPATVTDANVFLGRIPPGRFLGGEFTLEEEASHAVIRRLAKELRLDAEEAALGIVRVAEATMERALRTISLERGHDPRRFSLVAFGGAGALHAAALAESLGMRSVVVPRDPGLLSAKGMLNARITREYSRTVLGTSIEAIEGDPEMYYGGMQRDGARAMTADGVAEDAMVGERLADMRYAGQSYELTVPLGRNTVRAFERAHEGRYGFTMPGARIEIVNVRLRLHGPRPRRTRRPLPRGRRLPAPVAEIDAGFAEGRLATPVYERAELGCGVKGRGPAILVEYSATTLVPPGVPFRIDDAGTVVLELGEGGR